MTTERDGTLTANGLTADFRLLYVHPADADIYRVETASGESYAYGNQLTWDVKEGTQ